MSIDRMSAKRMGTVAGEPATEDNNAGIVWSVHPIAKLQKAVSPVLKSLDGAIGL